jgi:hypothetical protein
MPVGFYRRGHFMNVRRWSRVAIVVASLICLPLAARLSAKEKIRLEDLYRQESVSELTLRPGGDEAVYVRSWHDGTTRGRR